MIRANVGSSRHYSDYQPTHHQLRQPRAPQRSQRAQDGQVGRPMQPMRQSLGKMGPPGQSLAHRSMPPHWLDFSAPGTRGNRLLTTNFAVGNKSDTQSLPTPMGPAPHRISKQGWACLLAPTVALLPFSCHPPSGH
ncbi:hypothetical protein NDU88_003602 [Pleurodeles waltl]|uniref:Uncharacterized protein n=1 Tax=Pleurodeles waltl TaxID=8319 RepID=A0AAV7VGH3_PLEWA|nr:hypothetical protein NDU88_003602 [Pleurodeles waltl]